MHARTWSALIAGFLSTTALAQASDGAAAPPSAAASQAEPAKLPPEGKRWVEGFRGTWTAPNVKLSTGERDMPGKMKLTCVKSSAGWATICTGTFTAAGVRPEEDTFLMGWDVATKRAHMYEVTSAAEVHDHVGAWTDDNSITVTHRGRTQDGQEEEAAITFTWISAKELGAKGAGKVGGKTAWTMSATFMK